VNGHDPIRVQQWDTFKDSPGMAPKYWEIHHQIYKMVLKWSKKSKHAHFAVDALVPMLALNDDLDFFIEHSGALVSSLIKLTKDDELRLQAQKLLLEFVTLVPASFVTDLDVKTGGGGRANFEKVTNTIMSKLFPKRNEPTEEEAEIYQRLLLRLCELHIAYMIQVPFTKILDRKTGSSYTDTQKAILFRALTEFAKKYPEKMDVHLPKLGALTGPYIELRKERRNNKLLTAALASFPFIR
jgi:hypothetical protein